MDRDIQNQEILKGMPVWYPKLKEIYEEFLKEEALRVKSKGDASRLCS